MDTAASARITSKENTAMKMLMSVATLNPARMERNAPILLEVTSAHVLVAGSLESTATKILRNVLATLSLTPLIVPLGLIEVGC